MFENTKCILNFAITDDIDVPFSQPQSASPLQQSNQRKRKLPAQATLPSFGFKIPNKSSNERLSHAKARNIKLYSETEIGNSTGKMKIYRQYWNKAEDICANKEFANFSNAAVHGVINTAWALKKADDMLTEAKEMATALKDVPKSCLTGSSVCENTLVKNIRRLQNAREKINSTENALTDSRLEIIEIRKNMQSVPVVLKEKVRELEGKVLPSELTEIRASEESLRKTIDRRKEIIAKNYALEQETAELHHEEPNASEDFFSSFDESDLV